MSSHSGTRMVPELMGNPTTTNAHSLEEILRIAGQQGTDPFCSFFGSIQDGYAALVVAYSASGTLEGAWMSELMFRSPEAALEHAEDMVGPEIWSILGGCEW